jgi:uncharacterized protein with PIN domain
MPELFVFRAGNYPQGDWPRERVKKLVDSYDPENGIDAPVVIGHRFFAVRDADQYAHGWVESLRMDEDGKVYANIPEFSREARQAIAEKKLRYISVEIFEFDKVNAEQPPCLKAVALLGRDNPAVTGTKIPALFSLATGGVVNTVDEESHISTFTRKVSAEEMKTLSGESVEETAMDGKDDARVEELRAKLVESESKLAAFQKEREDIERAGRERDAQTFYSRLRDEGKLPPALYEKAVALDASSGDDARKEMRALFSGMEAKVDLSGAHVVGKGSAARESDSGLPARIRAFQKEKNLAGFADAAAALYAEKPELFEEEKNDD